MNEASTSIVAFMVRNHDALDHLLGFDTVVALEPIPAEARRVLHRSTLVNLNPNRHSLVCLARGRWRQICELLFLLS